MKIREITYLLPLKIYSGEAYMDKEVNTAFAGDMLSDVLSLDAAPDVLVTGLLNPQVIRMAGMNDTACVIFVSGKAVSESILDLAERSGICVLGTPLDTFAACGLLYGAGLRSVR